MARCLRTLPLAALALGLLGLGCSVGPKYQRPDLAPPEDFRFEVASGDAECMADLPWWEVFDDPVLQDLIRQAIANNLDLRIAAARVQEARHLAGVPKSFHYPQIDFGAGRTDSQVSSLSDPPQAGLDDDRNFQNWDAGFGFSWEIDIFGRIRRESEAAFARYAATEEASRGVLVTLVADVASQYFLIRELDLRLEIARRTVVSNEERVAFYRNRLEGGVSNRLELDQAEANRARTASVIPELERQIAVAENALSLLLGRPPASIPRGLVLTEQHQPPKVPAGLPASLIERRPDILQAERSLVAANADIGAAKALFFPTISITAMFGGLSREFGDLARGDAAVWSFRPGLLTPIFQGGRLRRNYRATKARFDVALAQYQKSALNGYREVSDALITIQKLAEVRLEQEKGVEALRNAAELSRARYDAGLANYLEVVLADQQLFDAELLLAGTRGTQLRAVSALYRSLGGGWQPEPALAAPAGQ